MDGGCRIKTKTIELQIREFKSGRIIDNQRYNIQNYVRRKVFKIHSKYFVLNEICTLLKLRGIVDGKCMEI